ncbi:MAG: hypothetical protein M0R05_06510 [Bacilli bacterium]|nr:hypothetical protein [Bacilli bacterium]MDD4076827.1 hypothetical protein [Bacilli bacterium]MDD4389142.1 hypothetical protein [Bacilli bacterium]
MRPAKALTVKKVFFRKGVVTFGVLITGLFSVILAILAWFGASTGNFIVMLDKTEYRRGIMLCEDGSFSKPSPRLYASSVGEIDNISYNDIDFRHVKESAGTFKDDPDFSYLAYTYYIKNAGEVPVNISYRIYITENYRNADEAIRVLLIENDEAERLFQKPDKVEWVYNGMPEAVYFIDNKTVCEDKITNFQPGEIRKFCVIIWLEGQDPDCTDEMLGGMIKLRMKFDIDEEE